MFKSIFSVTRHSSTNTPERVFIKFFFHQKDNNNIGCKVQMVTNKQTVIMHTSVEIN